jgi:hypothetical protein
MRSWSRLIRLEPRGATWTSDVDNASFHLAGPVLDPGRELAAFVRAAEAASERPPSEELDPRCRFPARAFWASRALGRDELVRPCGELDGWLQGLRPLRASMIFAAQYAGNPASFMGHLFLKVRDLHPGNRGEVLDLLDETIGFLALIPEDVGPLRYAWDGLTGGFQAAFVVNDFDRQSFQYQAIEDRDLWEYPLGLSVDELELLLRHYWELTHQAQFHYRFLTGNCAGMLASMILAVRPGLELPPGWSLFVTPHQVVRWLVENHLVSAPRSWPSVRAVALQRLKALTLAEQRSIGRDLDARAPSPGRGYAYYDALLARLDYLELERQEPLPAGEEGLRRESLRALAASPLPTMPLPPPPLDSDDPGVGHDVSYAAAGVGRDGAGAFADLELRPAAHALIDPRRGFRRDLAFEVLRMRGRYSFADARGRLSSLDLLHLKSIAPHGPLGTKPAWSAQVGYYDDDPERYAGGYAGLQAAFGLAAEPLSDVLVWMLPGFGLRSLGGTLDAGPGLELGLLAWDPSSKARLEATGSVRTPFDPWQGRLAREAGMSLGLAMELDQSTDARIELKRRPSTQGEARIVLGRFF